MEKIINKIVALLLICATILFCDVKLRMDVDSLYKKIPYASKTDTREIMHDLENFYINAVVQNDQTSIIKSLKGIIKCQKLLGLDASTYEKELAQRTGSKNPFVQTKKNTTLSHKSKEPSFLPLNIRSINTKENTIIIKFDHPVKKSDILSFALKQKGKYKKIFDLHANLNFRSNPIIIENIQKVKLAQNRRDKVRIVLENDSKIYAQAFIRQGTLFIKINNEHKSKEKAKFKPIKKAPAIILREKSVPLKHRYTSSKAIYADSKVIVIDAGHGGKDSGAIGYKHYQEKRTVLKVARLLKKALQKQGYKVYLTREDDTFVKLSNRTHYANQKKADLFISIHANAAPKKQKFSLKGIETFFLSPAKTNKAKRIAAKENASAMGLNRVSKDTLLSFLNRNKIIQSNKLAIDIQGGILSSVRQKYDNVVDGGVREAPFWVLVGAQMPAVLIEIGYITNPQEAERLFNPFYQKALVDGILHGINNYFIKNN